LNKLLRPTWSEKKIDFQIISTKSEIIYINNFNIGEAVVWRYYRHLYWQPYSKSILELNSK